MMKYPAFAWKRYLTILSRKKIPDRQYKWYVKPVEQYLGNHGNRDVGSHTATDVSAYLHKTVNDVHLTD